MLTFSALLSIRVPVMFWNMAKKTISHLPIRVYRDAEIFKEVN